MIDYAKAHSEEAVSSATGAAFKSMKDAGSSEEGLKAAMSALTALKVSQLPHLF